MNRRWSCLVVFLLVPAPGVAVERVLTTVAEVRGLTLEEAESGIPVRLSGVLTYAEPAHDLVFLQDETGGMFIPSQWKMNDGSAAAAAQRQGAWVEVAGISSKGKFMPFPAPEADGTIKARLLGERPLPRPEQPPHGGLPGPHWHSRWVEVGVFVRSAAKTTRWLELKATIGGKPVRIRVLGAAKDMSPELVQSDVRVRGVFTADFNADREMTGANFFVQSLAQLEIVDAGLAKAWAQPVRTIRDLMRYNPGNLARARVRGVITWAERGRGFFIGDGYDVAWVETFDGPEVSPGQVVEAAGFPAVEAGESLVKDAIIRVVAPTASTVEQRPPLAVTADELRKGKHHGRLVRIEARVTDRFTLPHMRSLALEDRDVAFQARLLNPGALPPLPEPGSRVVVTGVCEMLTGRGAGLFQVLLRSHDDIAVLATPPWWTVERVQWLAVGLGAIGLGVLTWGILLRRRVAAQTAIIAGQIERQRVTEERERIGQELHDTLEQHLAGVAMQLEVAESRAGEKAAGPLERAMTMLSHSRQEVRRSVWGLRSPVLELEGLAAALREMTTGVSTEKTEVLFSGKETPERLPPQTEFHLMRIAQEAVANALKHAHASKVTVNLEMTSTMAVLEIADDGIGFDQRERPADGRMHLGLLGMRDRATRLGAQLEIESTPGAGTRVRVTLETSR
jgi:signal transduction histidine kinase